MQPGWYLDASDRAWLRWYDGTNWTEHVAANPHPGSSRTP
ncbi:MAG: DUF2510 domain-containing protein [Acidimicrobiales bacterium]